MCGQDGWGGRERERQRQREREIERGEGKREGEREEERRREIGTKWDGRQKVDIHEEIKRQ